MTTNRPRSCRRLDVRWQLLAHLLGSGGQMMLQRLVLGHARLLHGLRRHADDINHHARRWSEIDEFGGHGHDATGTEALGDTGGARSILKA
jgi:hypothetical protein